MGDENSENTPITRKQKGKGHWQVFKKKKAEDEVKSKKIMFEKKRQRRMVDNSQFEMVPINGYSVKLPVGVLPYPSQRLIMAKILTALNTIQNVLVESPTGSGKTLALLASTCAWMIKYKEQYQEARTNCAKHGSHQEPVDENVKEELNDNASKSQGAEDIPHIKIEEDNYETELQSDFIPCSAPPQLSTTKESKENPTSPPCSCLPKRRIYYGTRTHKQIGQVVKEFRRLPYAGILRHTILASREQSCINEKARKSEDLTSFCKELLTDGGMGCIHKTNIRSHKMEVPQTMRRHVELHTETVFDIEDLVDGLKISRPAVCPYFTSTRILTKDSDIIFCPFSYLIDPIIRDSSDVTLQDSIIILDEAHNIEDTCRDGASFTFTERELSDTLCSLKSKAQSLKDTVSMNIINGQEAEHNEAAEYYKQLEIVLRFVSDVYDWFCEICEPVKFSSIDDYSEQRVQTHNWAFLADSLIRPDKKRHLYFGIDTREREIITEAFKAMCMPQDQEQGSWLAKYKPSGAAIVMVEKWLYFSDYFQDEKYKNTYRLHICMKKQNTAYTTPIRGGKASQGPRNIGYSTAEDIWHDSNVGPYQLEPINPGHITSISLWCMSPAPTFLHAFSPARNIILASGTLSPLETLKTELGLPFKVEVEGKQVIPNEKIFASVISKGPGGTSLQLTAKACTGNPQILNEVAAVIKDICLLVPRGILCFFASYAMMTKVSNLMRQDTVGNLLCQKKILMEEPRSQALLNDVMQKYEDVLRFPRRYGASIDGAVMLAVFRGKISEGIDFADDKARVVITVGIPYPNFGDPQVTEKKKYNSENSARLGILNGENWYSTQAYRALNQALGRCLRHKNDWGALVLIDERLVGQATNANTFQNRATPASSRVSKWIREQLKIYPDYNNFCKNLTQFINSMKPDVIPDSERRVLTEVE